MLLSEDQAMGMPDKEPLRAELLRNVEARKQEVSSRAAHLGPRLLAPYQAALHLAELLLALADAEWEWEARAAELEALQADRMNKAEKEGA